MLGTEISRRPWRGWDEAVAQIPGAGVAHRSAWLRVWSSLYGQESVGLLARRGGAPVAALPLVRRSHLVLGRYWVSMPFLDAAGAVGEPEAVRSLLERAQALARKHGDHYVELRHYGDQGFALPTHGDKVHVTCPLPADPDAILPGFKSKLRSQIRRALRERPGFVVGGPELAPDFHRVYAERMYELGSPPHSAQVFGELTRQLPGHSAILLIRLSGRIVAGGLLLHDGDTVRIPWAATLSSVNKLSMNMYLYYAALRWSASRGASHFDFGRTDPGSSHEKFKLQWGGCSAPLHWYRLELRQTGPKNVASRGKKDGLMQRASALYGKLPPELARALGPHLIRWF